MKLADDIDIDAALAVILDRAVERGGDVSMDLRVRIVAALALFPVAVRGQTDDEHGFRCASTRHVLGTVGRVADRRYVGKLHTYATKATRVQQLPGRHVRHPDAMAEVERALVALVWTVLDLATWRRDGDPARQYQDRLLTLPGIKADR